MVLGCQVQCASEYQGILIHEVNGAIWLEKGNQQTVFEVRGLRGVNLGLSSGDIGFRVIRIMSQWRIDAIVRYILLRDRTCSHIKWEQ